MLEGTHYQNAYVCDDIGAAIDLFRGRGLVKEPTIIPADIEVQTPNGPRALRIKLSLIWIDSLQYELIEVIEDPTGVYANCQSNGGPLRFHHSCMRVSDWGDFRARASQQDFPVAMEGDFGENQLKFVYLDARKVFGHYFEYTWMSDEQWQNIRAA